MCQAFSCIVTQACKVTWKLGVDSHSDLVRMAGYKDDVLGEFAKIEITPKNGDYLNPDTWTLRVDESPAPAWVGIKQQEVCWAAHKKWLKQLNKILVRKEVVHPFKVPAPAKITARHIKLLREWDSVRASVGDSVWASVGDSVRASVGDSVGDSVWDSVWASVGDSVRASVGDSVRASVWASVGAYTGSFFSLRKWRYVKHTKGKYPFDPSVKLWNAGLVPSFDGTTWRLHAGPKAKTVFEISAEELRSKKI